MMRAVIPLPDHDYYLWQALVQRSAFIDSGVDPVHVCYYQRRPSRRAQEFAQRWPDLFLLEADPRADADKDYNPMMKPWLVGRWLDQASEAERAQRFLYLDPDVILAGHGKVIAEYDHWPTVWAASDTDSYTGPDYIKSKGAGLWLDLCQIAGVNPVEAERYPGIGAQYIIGGTSADFWFEVAAKSHEGYRHMRATETTYTPVGHLYPIQSWCSEMYFTQLLAIREGFDPHPDARMSFLWANGPASEWDHHTFFHNAGVTAENGRDFCKVTWQQSPFRHAHHAHADSASARYVEEIARTETRFPELIWK